MSPPDSNDRESQQAYHRALRSVVRMLRLAGLTLALIGAVGVLLGVRGGWWVAPSWVSLILGLALILAGVISRARRDRGGIRGR